MDTPNRLKIVEYSIDEHCIDHLREAKRIEVIYQKELTRSKEAYDKAVENLAWIKDKIRQWELE